MTILARRSHFHIDARSRANLPRIALATLGMGAVLVVLRAVLDPALAGAMTLRLTALAGLVAGGMIAFLALSLLLGVVRWRELRRQFRRQPA
jgi:peptidoglycan biosynthesis protein MviN/MurJ (putative lipid II flippase)